MAESAQVEVFEVEQPGTVKCAAAGCGLWFVKTHGRHIYCRSENCTYKRGTPPARDLAEPEGAAQEMLVRLQEQQEGEIGPGLLVARVKAVQSALRASDKRGLYGALIDVATSCVWWADRVAGGEVPDLAQSPMLAAMPEAGRPAGIAHAVLASHQRTFMLAQRRYELVWELMAARDALASAQHAMQQVGGTPQEEEARAAEEHATSVYAQAERAMQSVEAAWGERAQALGELEAAVASTRVQPSRGAGNVSPAAA